MTASAAGVVGAWGEPRPRNKGTQMDPQTAYERRDEVLLLDVREQEEWDAGHIEGSVHIPMGELGARQEELPSDRPIVAVCRSGNRSAAVTQALSRAGYEAHNLVGGVAEWKGQRLPLVDADGAPGEVA
jgi:rhodanese-related sulfurtransferase